jgi:hypothetical protein
MKKTIIKFISLALTLSLTVSILSLMMSGCSSSEKLYLFNYGDYIDPEVYDMFEEEYGIRVVYDEYAAPEDMYAKFVSGTARYDGGSLAGVGEISSLVFRIPTEESEREITRRLCTFSSPGGASTENLWMPCQERA